MLINHLQGAYPTIEWNNCFIELSTSVIVSVFFPIPLDKLFNIQFSYQAKGLQGDLLRNEQMGYVNLTTEIENFINEY